MTKRNAEAAITDACGAEEEEEFQAKNAKIEDATRNLLDSISPETTKKVTDPSAARAVALFNEAKAVWVNAVEANRDMSDVRLALMTHMDAINATADYLEQINCHEGAASGRSGANALKEAIFHLDAYHFSRNSVGKERIDEPLPITPLDETAVNVHTTDSSADSIRATSSAQVASSEEAVLDQVQDTSDDMPRVFPGDATVITPHKIEEPECAACGA